MDEQVTGDKSTREIITEVILKDMENRFPASF